MPQPARRVLFRALLVGTALACSDSRLAPTIAPATPGETLTRVDCRANVQSLLVVCSQADTNAGGLSSSHSALGDLIVGGQNSFIALASNNVSYSGDVFSFNATVENLIGQKLGTTDGTTLATSGVRVFFTDSPVATAGSGVIDFTDPVGGGPLVDGFAAFTASTQAYYEYDQIIIPNETSAAKTWRIHVPASVTSFTFSVYVSAPVQYATGYVDVTPATVTVAPTATQPLTATVRDVVGRALTGETVTWSTSNAAVATVDAGSGVVTGVTGGQVTITATSTTRTGTATVLVAGAPTQIDSVTNTVLVQTASASTSLTATPQIKISDVNGNPVSGVTPAWSLGTCHSGATLNGSATASNGSGVATSPQLSFTANTGLSCAIVATVPGMSNSPMTFTIYVAPTASSLIWVGRASTEWATAANWYAGAAPTSTDDVFIPIVTTSARLPALSSAQSAAAIATESGVATAISLGGNTLTATGSVNAFSPITATTGGMQLSGAAATTVQGTLPATTIGTTNCANGGACTLTGNLSTTGQLTVNCMLSVGANTLDTYTANGADLVVQGTAGILDMTNGSGVVKVKHATFSGANSNGHLTAGTLDVYGNFRQRSTSSVASFSPTSAHVTRMMGTTVNDSVYFQSTDTTAANLNSTSHFYNLRVSTAAAHKMVFVGYESGDPHGLNTNLHVAGNLTIDQGDTLHIESANQEARLKVRGTATLNGVLRTTVDSASVVDVNVDGAVASPIDSSGHFQLDAPAGTARMDVGGSFTLLSNTGSNFTGLATLTVRGALFEYDASGGIFPGTVSMVSSSAQTFRIPAATLFNAVHDSTTGTLTVRNGFVTETLVIGVNSGLKMFDVLTSIELGKTVNGSGGSILFFTGASLNLSGGSLSNLSFRTLSGQTCQYKTDGNGNPLVGSGDALRWLANLSAICFGSTSLAAAPIRTLMPLGNPTLPGDAWIGGSTLGYTPSSRSR